MNLKKYYFLVFVTTVLLSAFSCKTKSNNQTKSNNETRIVWSKEKANKWYKNQPWLVGANYNPST
ncbi:MAG: 1,4-beta-xylanase, partial [Flavobacteriales bacterium]|nr:1,4-beta-xylanase [Flavobacteriales bacterium]